MILMQYIYLVLVVFAGLFVVSCAVIAKDKAEIVEVLDDVIEEIAEDISA